MDAVQVLAVGTGGGSWGAAADGEFIWAVSTDKVTQVRASTGEIVGMWSGATDAFSVVVVAGKVFVAGNTMTNGSLYEIDPTTAPGTVTTAVASGLGNGSISIAFDGTNLWTANFSLTGSISIIQPVSPYAVTTITSGFSCPAAVMYDGRNMWVTDNGSNQIHRTDSSGNILQSVTTGAGPLFPCFDGTNIWVPNSSASSVTIIDAASGNVSATIASDANNQLNQPGCAIFDGKYVMVANQLGPSVTWFDAKSLAFVHNLTVTDTPYYGCTDGINFWMSVGGGNNLYRL